MSEKYIRQILVHDFGGTAQAKLARAHVALIGLGGIGAPAALYLAGAGIGEITIFEDDDIDASNLHRQVIYRSDDIGKPKAEAGKAALNALNPDTQIHLAGRFDDPTPQDFTLILDGTDNLTTRHAVNRYAQANNIPLLCASLAQWEGQIAHFSGAPCYACLYPENTDPAALPSCSEAGVIGAVAGMIGTTAALEAVKLIANINPLPAGEMLLIDGKYQETRRIKISSRAGCPHCRNA